MNDQHTNEDVMNDQHTNEDVPHMREMLYIFVTKHKNSR